MNNVYRAWAGLFWNQGERNLKFCQLCSLICPFCGFYGDAIRGIRVLKQHTKWGLDESAGKLGKGSRTRVGLHFHTKLCCNTDHTKVWKRVRERGWWRKYVLPLHIFRKNKKGSTLLNGNQPLLRRTRLTDEVAWIQRSYNNLCIIGR